MYVCLVWLSLTLEWFRRTQSVLLAGNGHWCQWWITGTWMCHVMFHFNFYLKKHFHYKEEVYVLRVLTKVSLTQHNYKKRQLHINIPLHSIRWICTTKKMLYQANSALFNAIFFTLIFFIFLINQFKINNLPSPPPLAAPMGCGWFIIGGAYPPGGPFMPPPKTAGGGFGL